MPQYVGLSVSDILERERELENSSNGFHGFLKSLRCEVLKKPLAEVIPNAKPSWKERDVKNVIQRLKQVNIRTTEEFDIALRGDINGRFKNRGLKTFNPDTLTELRAYFCQNAITLQAESSAVQGGAAEGAGVELGAAAVGGVRVPPPPVAADGAHAAAEAAALEGHPAAKGAPAAAETAARGRSRSAVARWAESARSASPRASPRAATRAASPADSGDLEVVSASKVKAAAAARAEEEEEESQDIPDYSTLLKSLDNAADTEALEQDARQRGIPVERLENRCVVAALLDSLDSLNDASIKDLRARCDHFRLAYIQSTPKDDLRRLLKDGLIWDEMEAKALREECLARGLPSDALAELSRKELAARLAGSTWEALGVPMSRFPDLSQAKARDILEELRRQEELSPESLAKRGSQQWDLPPHLPRELLTEWMRKIAVWQHLPASELRQECLRMGLEIKEPPEVPPGGPDVEDTATQKFFLLQLLCGLQRARCQAAGVSPERVGGCLADAEAVVQEFAALERLDLAALKAEAARFDVTELHIKEGPDAEREELLRLLKDVEIWSRMPLDALRNECRGRDVVFPEVFMASANGGVPVPLFIAGSWTNYQPVEMKQVGKKFRCTLEIGPDGEEVFQLLLPSKSDPCKADWNATLYPSVEEANPHVPHCVLGPNAAGHGRNWSIGTHAMDEEFSEPGAKCTVTVSFEEDTPAVTWDSEGRLSQILKKRPNAPEHRRNRSSLRLRPGRAPMDPVKKQAIKELMRQEVMLRALAAEGVSVSKIPGPILKDLLEEINNLNKTTTAVLHDWYHNDVGFPREQGLEHQELLTFIKRMAAWQALPLEVLKEECAKVEVYPNNVINEKHKDGTREEQKAYFVDKLLDQDRMEAWERRGFEARRIKQVDAVIDLVCDFEQVKGMGEAEFKQLWLDSGMPEEDLQLPMEKKLATIKRIMVWASFPLPQLQEYCRESGLPIDADRVKGQTDEEFRNDLLNQLRIDMMKSSLEAGGIPVSRLGLLKTAQVLGSLQRYQAMDAKALRDAYEGDQKFLPASMQRETILEYVKQVAIWEALPMTEFLKECEAHGMDMVRVKVEDAAEQTEETQNELRAALLERLIFRKHMAKCRTSSPITAPEAPGSAAQAGPGKLVAVHPPGSLASPSLLRSSEENERAVWPLVDLMQDPFLAERLCHCPRKPPVARAPLPIQSQRWRPIEAALHILSSKKFHPDLHGAKARAPPPSRDQDLIVDEVGPPASVPSGKPLISVVCPTSESRQPFHQLLYECYQTQDYEPKELIVVDSGSQESSFFKQVMETDPSVVYRFFPVEDARDGLNPSKVAWSLGLKRNIGCCIARGVGIAHFDDDDLYAEGYLSWMYEGLAAVSDEQLLKPAAAKLTDWYLLDMTSRQFRYLDVISDPNVPQLERRNWLYGWGFSYVFTRSAWEMSPFPDVAFAEDIGFLEGLMARDVPVKLMPLPPNVESPGASPSSASLPQCLVAHSFHLGSTSGGEFDGRQRSGRSTGPPELVRHLQAMVEKIMGLQQSPVGGSRFNPMNRPPLMPGGKVLLQPGFRTEDGVSFPMVTFKRQTHTKGLFR